MSGHYHQIVLYLCLCVLRFGGGAAAEATGEVDGEEEEGEKEDKAAANYGLSGKLTAETNTFKVSSTLMCIIDNTYYMDWQHVRILRIRENYHC